MSSTWINHVKRFAREHGLPYSQALKHPHIKHGYTSHSKRGRGSQCSGGNYQRVTDAEDELEKRAICNALPRFFHRHHMGLGQIDGFLHALALDMYQNNYINRHAHDLLHNNIRDTHNFNYVLGRPIYRSCDIKISFDNIAGVNGHDLEDYMDRPPLEYDTMK